mgnify:FL=1
MGSFSWLASYPKSGNTWFRIVAANLYAEGNEPVDINDLPERGGISSARTPFDNILLVDSDLLTHEECDRMRPMLYRAMAREEEQQLADPMQLAEDKDRIDGLVRMLKCHDAWTYTDLGEPLLGGREAARNAILIVRDPRDVAPSLANHNDITIDAAIDFMRNRESSYCGDPTHYSSQLRQQLPGWSGHTASWLDQRDIPVHLVRYEDMEADPVETIQAALSFAGRQVDRGDLARAVDLASFDRLREQEARSRFAEARPGRTFFRRGQSGGWRDDLADRQVARIERDHAAMMDRLGYARSYSLADLEHILGESDA